MQSCCMPFLPKPESDKSIFDILIWKDASAMTIVFYYGTPKAESVPWDADLTKIGFLQQAS